jgi:hypothetical protein
MQSINTSMKYAHRRDDNRSVSNVILSFHDILHKMPNHCEENSWSTNNCLYPRHVRRQQTELLLMSISRFHFPQFQQNIAGKGRSQNKTIQDAPRKGRNATSGGLLSCALPHEKASPRPSPASATCSSIKAVSFRWCLVTSPAFTGPSKAATVLLRLPLCRQLQLQRSTDSHIQQAFDLTYFLQILLFIPCRFLQLFHQPTTSPLDAIYCIHSSMTGFLHTIDTDVCIRDPYSCKQLQQLERLIFNIFNTINITTLKNTFKNIKTLIGVRHKTC